MNLRGEVSYTRIEARHGHFLYKYLSSFVHPTLSHGTTSYTI